MRGNWYVDFRHEYQRVRKRSPENSRAGALAYEATLRGRLARGQPMIPALRRPAAKPRFEAFASRWYAIYVETNNKPSEQKAKRLILRNHLVPLFGALTLDAITTLHAEEFKAAKLNSGLAPKSINNCLAVLGKCLRTAEEWGEIDRVPKLKLLRVPPQKFDFLSREEATRLIRAVRDTHWRAMITVALRTGLRLGELVALDWSDVNLETRLLTVRQSAFGDQIGSPKSNRIRHVPLTDGVQRTLQPIQQTSGFVFSRSERKPLNDQMARRIIAKLCKEAAIRPVGWHVLRHTFASHLVTAGVSIKAVQELLGHSDVRTTMRYAHLAPSVLQEAIRVLEPPAVSEDTFGQPVGNAFTTAERQTTETPQFMGRF